MGEEILRILLWKYSPLTRLSLSIWSRNTWELGAIWADFYNNSFFFVLLCNYHVVNKVLMRVIFKTWNEMYIKSKRRVLRHGFSLLFWCYLLHTTLMDVFCSVRILCDMFLYEWMNVSGVKEKKRMKSWKQVGIWLIYRLRNVFMDINDQNLLEASFNLQTIVINVQFDDKTFNFVHQTNSVNHFQISTKIQIAFNSTTPTESH